LRILLRRFLISEPIARETLPAWRRVPNASLPEEAAGAARSTAPACWPRRREVLTVTREPHEELGGTMADDEIDLNAQIEVELTPYGSLDLDEEWVAYLSDSAEIPAAVAGVDPAITYDDDGTNTAMA
jgi:hypothetical protein